MGEKTEVARPRRVVLDTNVAVSALVFREGQLAWLRGAWAAGRVVPLVSAATLAELVRVLAYPKLKLSDEETKNVLAHYIVTPRPCARPARSSGSPNAAIRMTGSSCNWPMRPKRTHW